ncbi:MAG: hypothetical protein WA139_00495 [Candidatus Aenigmatarchaeota archaeon]
MKDFRDNELEELKKYMTPEGSELVRFGDIGINKSQIEKMKTVTVRDAVKRPTNFGGVLDSSGVIDVVAVYQGDKNQGFYFGDFLRYLKNSSVALMEIEPYPQIQLSYQTNSGILNDQKIIDAGRKGLPTIYAGYGNENARIGVFKVRDYAERSIFRKPRLELEKSMYSLNGKLESNNNVKFENKDGIWRNY